MTRKPLSGGTVRIAVRLCAVTLSVLALASRADAQMSQDSARRYPLPTYDENWQFLSNRDARADPWDALKYIPIGADGAFVSVGGEARETYERFGNQNFGLSTPSPNGYVLQRYLLHADLRVTPRFRVWGELSSSIETGRNGGARPIIDENKLDVHQAFVEGTVLHHGATAVRLRIGRQEMTFGSGRLYSLREGVNVPFSLDGARITAQKSDWQVDAWAARPVIAAAGIFDDRSHHSFGVWGVYATHRDPRRASVDTYYLGWDRANARFDQGTAHELRHTLGVRVWHAGSWAYDAEAMYQFGTFGAGDIRAWRGVFEGSRGLDTRWHPRIGYVFDAASGDPDRTNPNLGTFNAFFQSGTYSGRAQLLGPNNSIRLEPSISIAPWRALAVATGWGFYWRQSEQDGLYGIPGNLIVPSNGVPGHYEGSRPIVQADWSATPHLSLHASYIFVFNARYEEQSVHGTSTESYVSSWITYRF